MTQSIFEFHTGIRAEPHGIQSIMNCPFCEKDDKFFFNNDSFLWDCKVCGKSGNPVIFLRELYEQFDNITSATKFLSHLREVPISAVSLSRPKYNPLNGSYLIPTFRHGKLNNIYKACLLTETDNGVVNTKWRVIASPGIEHTLMSWEETFPDELWIIEGPWDRMAASAIIQSHDIGATATPGANVWKAPWCEVFNEHDIVFCYHHDAAGRIGFESVILKHIATSQFKPKSIRYIHWPEEKKVGYDLNDAYKEYGRAAYNHIASWIRPYTAPTDTIVVKTTFDTVEADKSCTSYEELLNRYEQVFHTTDSMRLGLLLVLSSIYSVKVEGEQLWIRLIGPPSSGKTTLAKCVSGSSQVVLKSTFTGLFSGWRDEKDAGKDASLVPIIAGKTLIVKDADALLKQKNVEEIFSQLRDFYDKDSSIFYKNMVNHEYKNIRSTMVLCGTNVLRRSDQSFLGERFMDFELELSENDRDHIEERMLSRSIATALDPSALPPETPVIAAAKGFLEHIWEKPVSVLIGPREMDNIRTYAKLAAAMRTKVDREKFGEKDISFRPVIEVPARLIGQLTKLYMCASVILGIEKPNDIVHNLIRKVARDIIDPSCPRYKICKLLCKDYFSRDQLHDRYPEISRQRIILEMTDLVALEMVDNKKCNSDSTVGSKVFKFKLKEQYSIGLEYL